MFATEKIREAFSLYEMDGMLSVADLGTVIRSLGQNPSMAELQAWVKERDLRRSFDTRISSAAFGDPAHSHLRSGKTRHSPVGRSSRSWSSQVRPNSWRAERTAPAWRSSAARMPGAIPGGLAGWLRAR